MNWMTAGRRAALALGALMTLAACSAYPDGPRYPIYADAASPVRAPASSAARPPAPSGEGVRGPTDPATEAHPPSTAPVAVIEGGALHSPGRVPAAGPASEGFAAPPPPAGSVAALPGATYVIQPGDTISGVGRRFQTPVQVLIDLNGLGPRGAITSGQRIILPDSAVDTGSDPYATGPSPVGVRTPNSGVTPPPPPPPSGNAALPPPTRTPAVTAPTPSAGAVGQPLALQWPVRGDILRRFGPVGMGERNNGINIGAAAGAEVKASADGTVAYVGDDIVGQGLTVLIVHRDGWRTVYGHLGSATVRDGAQVRAGQVIGTVGLTAGDGRPSIHYEVRQRRGDDPVALDPLTVLPR